jgi:nitroreductase
MTEALETLLAQAVRAPSGDNMQPWRFVVDAEAGTIVLDLDPTRDPSPMNAGQRMARIAIGAALENLLRAAGGLGWAAELDPDPRPFLARVRLTPQGGVGEDLGRIATARVTNRRPYDGRPVPAAALDRLARATPDLDGTRTVWIGARERVDALARVISRADGVMFGEPSMLRAFLKNVRFDAPPTAEVDEGLSLASLELSAANRLALRVMPRLPDRMLRLAGVSRALAANTLRLVRGSSGLCLVAAPDGAEATDLVVGRAVQRAWLALAEQGMAAQPMMSLPVLENALEHGDAALQEALGRDRVAALRDEFRALVPELGGGRLAWLKRFGFAPPPSGRTGRLPLEAVTTHSRPIHEGVA